MPATDISVAAIVTIRPSPRIVSSPGKCQLSTILRPIESILHHAGCIPRARSAPDWHRADVRGGRVLRGTRHDREIPQPLHGHAAGRMGALYRRVPVSVHRVESMDPTRPDAHRQAGAADRPFGPAAGLDAVQFPGAALSAAR